MATHEWFNKNKIRIGSNSFKPTPAYGIISWVLGWSDFEHYPRGNQNENFKDVRFEKVVAQVRHPLATISNRAMMHLDPYIEYHIPDNVPRSPDPDTHLLRALTHWVTWHEHILDVADSFFRVEDSDIMDLCLTYFAEQCPQDRNAAQKLWKDIKAVNLEDEADSIATTTWAELERVSPEYAAHAKKIAFKLGYCAVEENGDNTQFRDTFTRLQTEKLRMEEQRKMVEQEQRIAEAALRQALDNSVSGKPITAPEEPSRVATPTLPTPPTLDVSSEPDEESPSAPQKEEPQPQPEEEPVKAVATTTTTTTTNDLSNIHTHPLRVNKFTTEENPLLNQYNYLKNSLETNPGKNIGGSALVEVPAWVKGTRKGKYYLFSSMSEGQYIRFAYADDVAGPYHTVELGVLQLESLAFCKDHVANPSVVVDDEAEKLYMYFHCGGCASTADFKCKNNGEVGFRAESSDGLSWSVNNPVAISPSNARVFRAGSFYYFFTTTELFASRDGVTDIIRLTHMKTSFITALPIAGSLFMVWSDSTWTSLRYGSLQLENENGDAPMHLNWNSVLPGSVLLEGTEDWEVPVHGGTSTKDPSLTLLSDGRLVVTYTSMSSRAIAIAEIAVEA